MDSVCRRILFRPEPFIAMVRELEEAADMETGGILLGTAAGGLWRVIEHIDPGYRGVLRSPGGFEYDREYVTHLANVRNRVYDPPLALLGLWHRHPGSFDVFSPTDQATNEVFARSSPEGALSLILNLDPGLRISAFHVSQGGKCRRVGEVEVEKQGFPVPGGGLRGLRQGGWIVTKGDDNERFFLCQGGKAESLRPLRHRLTGPRGILAGLLPRADE
jgi:hypothetical protein